MLGIISGITEATFILRIIVEVPMEDRDVVFDFCKRREFKMLSSGPKIIEFPKVDPDTFTAILERRI